MPSIRYLGRLLASPTVSILSLILVLLLTGCGNKRGPTGGPADLTHPEVLYTSPAEYEQITDNEIVIAFSKVMDKTSVLTGLNVHPQKINKKIHWKKNDLHIVFSEPLPADKNVLVFLNKNIKCERGNTLTDHQILVFKHGTLQTNTLSGFVMSDEDFEVKDINYTLLDSDSLLVLTHTSSESSYSFTYLNPGKHSLSAYIDLNKNNRFDYSIDPAFSKNVDLPQVANMSITLAIADTTKPVVTSIISQYNNQVTLKLNKQITSLPIIYIFNDSTHTEIPILHKELTKEAIYLVTAPLDSLSYRLHLGSLTDSKGNTTTTEQKYFDATGQPSQNTPKIVDTSPKNGNVIRDKNPNISITFDQIIFSRDVKVYLKETESNRSIQLNPVNSAGLTLIYKPATELQVFNTYLLTISKDTTDNAGNALADDHSVQFIVTN